MSPRLTIDEKIKEKNQEFGKNDLFIIMDVKKENFLVWKRVYYFFHKQSGGECVSNTKFFLFQKIELQGILDGKGKKKPSSVEGIREMADMARKQFRGKKDVEFNIGYWIIKGNDEWGYGQSASYIPTVDLDIMLKKAVMDGQYRFPQ